MVDQVDKEDKFRSLAQSRVNAAILKIRLIKKLSNKSHYAYTPSQIKKIRRVLIEEVDDALSAFGGSSEKKQFTLD
tara:strand:- start:2577 stop:2804 length:228 start_codon:yes stop_codon:yes gene_type:complete